MAIISKLFITTCAFFLAIVRCDGAKDEFPRDEPRLIERSGYQWEAQIFLRNVSEETYQTPFSRPLDSRSLLESWMGKRQETCLNSADSPCADGSGCCPTVGYGCCPNVCCPTGKNCCTTTNACADPGDVCCAGGFTCPSGWNCCTEGTCYPNGGQCCSTGFYCTAGNICVLVNGAQKCCTDNTCTAHVSGGVTISAPSLPTSTDSALSTAQPAPTTAAPSQATLSVIYTYYYYTITYYYFSWYWTIFLQQSQSTYSEITTYTTISIYETNSAAAFSSFLAVSQTLSLETPAAASTLSPLPASTSPSSARAGGGGETTVSESINTSLHAGDEPSTTTAGESQSSSTGKAAGNAAVGLRPGMGGGGKEWIGGLVALWVCVGGLMVWL